MSLLHHAFETVARRWPEKVALVAGQTRLCYRELHRAVHALALALRGDGLEPGDRVLLMLENSIEYAIGVHAVLAAGGVFVPVGPTTKAEKLAFLACDTGAKVLLTDVRLRAQWLPAIEHAHQLCSVRVAGILSGDGLDCRLRQWPRSDQHRGEVEVARIDQDLAALIYTSGSTGISKGVMLTHLNMTSAWASVQAYLGLREDDVIGLALSPAFSYGLYNLLMGLGLGSTVVLMHNAAFPLEVANTLAHERVSVFPGVPTLFSSLLGVPALASLDLGALRLITNAAAALPEAHVHRLRAAFPRARLLSMYGLTECKRASYLPAEEIERRPCSVGRGMPNQEHWLIDESGRRLPHGASGELVVRGSHVMRGYWARPEETRQRLRPGASGEPLLHTGDLFRSDAEGWLYFLGRKDDIIKTRGEKVSPREVESTIHQLDSVLACAVVGVADSKFGEAVKAYVRLQPGSTLRARDIIKHCLARLENYMVPKFVELVEDLPRTESGKIRHASLR